MTNTTLLTQRFDQALLFATQLHRHQTRKGTQIPYISHLLSVTALVLESGGNEDEAIAALLHDAIEDQGGDRTRQEIRHRFGDTVSSIIEACTESDVQPKPPWRDRKLRQLERLRSASLQIQRVMLADKVHNARSTLAELQREGPQVWNKFKAGREGTLWFYNAVLGIVGSQESWLCAELARLVTALEEQEGLGS